MAYTLKTPIQQRFSDIDTFQHVNNVAQQEYFDVGKSAFFRLTLDEDCTKSRQRVVAVSTNTSYLAQIRLFDEVYVLTSCEKVGNKSLTIFQQLFANDRLCSESRSVFVAFDFDEQISIPVPERWREQLLKK